MSIIVCLSVAPEWIQHYVILKYITGLRQTDMLNLHSTRIREDGIYVVTSKSGGSKRLHFKMNYVMAEVLDIIDSGDSQVLKTNVKTMGYYLFRTRQNKKYTADGFRSIWHRYMTKALKNGSILAKFQERDLRSKTASESENLEAAKRLLGHSSETVTRRHYHHEYETVEPLNKKLKE